MIPIRREAINLRVNGVECAGTFFYDEIKDERFDPPISLKRESWLEFTVPSTAPKDIVYSFGDLFTCDNKEVDVEDNGNIYKAFITDWEVSKFKKIFTGRMVMINKWYD